MVKVPIKRKLKIKQRIKQKVKVSQNVKVIIGDIKRKRAVKSTGAKPGLPAKPPIVLNISNPQPNNNVFMEYFKKQFQNQTPIKGTTLAQNEIINEREENKASRAGALHKLDQEPNDIVRELKRQRIEEIERYQRATAEKQQQKNEIVGSLKPVSARKISSTPLRPRQQTQRELLMESLRSTVPLTPPANTNEMRPDTLVLNYMQDQQQELEDAMQQASREQQGIDDEEPRQDTDNEEPRQDIPTPTPQPKRKGRGKNKTLEEKKAEADEKIRKAEEREAIKIQKESLKQEKKKERKRGR